MIDAELVDLYLDERPGMDRNVVAAFIEAGMEPPMAERVTSHGFDAAERKVLDDYYVKYEPHGSWKVGG